LTAKVQKPRRYLYVLGRRRVGVDPFKFAADTKTTPSFQTHTDLKQFRADRIYSIR